MTDSSQFIYPPDQLDHFFTHTIHRNFLNKMNLLRYNDFLYNKQFYEEKENSIDYFLHLYLIQIRSDFYKSN